MQLPGWHYDELRQVGVDFNSIDQVAGRQPVDHFALPGGL